MAKKNKPSSKITKTNDSSKETMEQAQKLVTERFKNASNFRSTEQEAVWTRSYNNWKGKLDSTKFPWRSKLFIPWSFTVVETIIPKVFARDPQWRAISGSPDFPEDGPRVVQNLLTYQWSKAGMRLKMYDYIKDSLMYSKGYVKVTWGYQSKVNTFMEPITDENNDITFEKKQKSSVSYDDPCIDVVDPFDIYVDPDATSLENADYVIHRTTIPLSKVKENPNYKNTDEIKQDDSNQKYFDTLNRGNQPSKDTHKHLVEILEYWEQDRLIVVANRSVVLRDSPNPYSHKRIPFVELDDYRDPHKYYGQSELSVIDPLQREINAIRNQRRDYDNLALNPVIRMVPGALKNPNSAVMSPGNVWMVSDLNSMDVFEMPQLQGTARDIENQTSQDIKMAVAIDEIGIGLLPDNPQRRSATEVVTAQSMAGKRFAIKIALLEEAVKKIGELVFALNQQFMSEERIIQIVGQRGLKEWVKLTPEDIRGTYYVDIETGSMLPKDEIAARQEAVQLLQYITPIISPVIQSNPNVIMPVIQMVLDTFELPGKQAITDELRSALGAAKQQVQQKNLAEQAATEAGAISQVQGAMQPQVDPAADVAPPENAQGRRADLELEQLASAQ